MVKEVIPEFCVNWRSSQLYVPREDDSDAELDAFLQECQAKQLEDLLPHTPKKRYEYVVSGIFQDPGPEFNATESSGSAVPGGPGISNEDPLTEDPIYNSLLYKELLETLSHLMEIHEVEVYEQITFTRNSAARSTSALNFTKTGEMGQSRSIEVHIHKATDRLKESFMLRTLYNEKGSSTGSDVSIRNMLTPVGNDIVTVLQLQGYNISKRLYVCGHVFTNNYGNHNHIEIAVMRHYLDCNPATPVCPKSLLVEVRCIGDGEVETYRNLLSDYTKILYKYVNFSME